MINERVKKIIDDLEMFDEDIDKYEYIVDIGKNAPDLEENLKKDEFLVHGCTSKVWLIPQLIDGKLNFKADSNSVIVKGLVTILVSIFQNLYIDDILNFNNTELEKLNLTEIISPTRQNGVYHMLNKIRHYAEVYKEGV